MFKRVLLPFLLLLSSSLTAQTFPYENRSVLVGGDTKVHLVDLEKSQGETPHVVWTWDAREIQDLPEDYRKRFFNSVDDSKPVNEGKQLLISSSSGGVVLWDLEKNATIFYTHVPNAHSIEMLPDGLIAAAASTHPQGNQIQLFDLSQSSQPIDTDELYSAHGVVWHRGRKTLFALGFDVLREYKIEQAKLVRVKEWKIPGKSGHDLTLSPDQKFFFITEHTGAWQFDLEHESFESIPNFPNAENIKSLNQAKNGQFLYTVPEESWWTYHVSLHQPTQKLAFPGMKAYKTRWYRE